MLRLTYCTLCYFVCCKIVFYVETYVMCSGYSIISLLLHFKKCKISTEAIKYNNFGTMQIGVKTRSLFI